jgi:hypothetical protein
VNSIENRIEKLERKTAIPANRETLIIYPGGEILHYSGEGPVAERHTISTISKHAAESLLKLLNGESPCDNQD